VKYKNLAELADGSTRTRAEGGEPPVLTVDNDDTQAYEGGECVFRMHPDQVLEQALDLLGIEHGEA
jgi:hypothetical protein